MKFYGLTACITALLLSAGTLLADEHEHYDMSLYLQDGQLLTGGLTHDGDSFAPPITVYGYEFGEDSYDPYNPSDPGVNQAAGVGNLPAGAAVSYNILSSLLYWDGTGDVSFGSSGDAYITLWMSTQSRRIDADSGTQSGTYIQSVASDGNLHKHFVTSLYADDGAGNIPGIGDPTYLAPADGIYAFSIEMVLTDGGMAYTSDPVWLVFNNGLDESAHEAAMEALAVPEPATMTLLGLGAIGLIRRRRRAKAD